MKAVLLHIRAEPGQWTALKLSRDFGILERSTRKTLKILETRGLIRSVTAPCDCCGHKVVRYFPRSPPNV